LRMPDHGDLTDNHDLTVDRDRVKGSRICGFPDYKSESQFH
jgi:hypothetical protein